MKFLVLQFILIGSFCVDVNAQLFFNKVDSLGYKQGMWKEYKILPSSIQIDSELKTDPSDSTILYVFDKKDFGKDCIVIDCYGKYKNGMKTGIWTEKYPNDTIKSVVEYKNGIPYGMCKIYYPNGSLRMKCEIEDNSSFPVMIYNESGELKERQMALKKKVVKFIYEE